MKLIKKALVLFLSLSLLSQSTIISTAHSGRTDAYGGHHDYNNVSGLGSYHYHHGYGPHLHPNGVCPYTSPSVSTKRVSKTTKTNKAYQKKLNKLGYLCGTADGVLGAKSRRAIKKFQRKYGLSATGNLNKSTKKKITAVYNKRY